MSRLTCGLALRSRPDLLAVLAVLWLLGDLIMRGWSPAAKLLYLGFTTLLVFAPMYLAIREAGFIVRT